MSPLLDPFDTLTLDAYEPFDQSCVPNDIMGLFFIK